MLIDKIERAEILTLDKRYYQALELQAQCMENGINAEIFLAGSGELKKERPNIIYNHIDEPELPTPYVGGIRYPTWYNRPNAYNAWKCHRKMMQSAVADNLNNLLMLEDDSFIEDDFYEILKECEKFFERPWDMIYFGCYHNGNSEEVGHPHIRRINGGGGFHGVLLSRPVMEELLNAPPLGPYDWMAGKFLHSVYEGCYAIYPCVISQKDGHSYVEGHELSKPDRWKI